MDLELELERNEGPPEIEKLGAQLHFNPQWQNFDEDECDPGTLWASANDLLDLIKTTDSQLHDRHGALASLQEQCQKVLGIVVQLEELLMMYAKHPPTYLEDSPIDPMLGRWMSDCNATIIDLNRESEQEAENEKLLEDWDVVSTDGVESIADTLVETEDGDATGLPFYEKKLERLCREMQDFLPIIRCDINVYVAAQISCEIPRALTPQQPYRGATEHAHHLEYMRSRATATGSTQIRTVLYELKDVIKGIQSDLVKHESSLEGYGSGYPFPGDDFLLVSQLMRQNTRILDVITEALTNHGSEWIESMLANKLTYAEYKNLNVAGLGNIRKQYQLYSKGLVSKNRCEKNLVKKLMEKGQQLERMLKIQEPK